MIEEIMTLVIMLFMILFNTLAYMKMRIPLLFIFLFGFDMLLFYQSLSVYLPLYPLLQIFFMMYSLLLFVMVMLKIRE